MIFLHITAEGWEFPIIPTAGIVVTSAVYLRGFAAAHRNHPRELPEWRKWSFLSAMTALFLALASPVDTLADRFLLAHMTQHLILMSVVPPLAVAGAPSVPFLRGLPRWVVHHIVAPMLRLGTLRAVEALRNPAVAWLLMNVAYVGWHVPRLYETALRSESWHDAEHLCFLLTSVLFWWNVIEPWPSRRRLTAWAAVPYLLGADIVNTGLCAYLCFAGRVLYPSYGVAAVHFHFTALNDQIAAGAEMWVLGSMTFLVPLSTICFKELSPQGLAAPEAATTAQSTQ